MALAAIVWLASMASRALGMRIEEAGDADDTVDERWLKELSVLKLEERHPVCGSADRAAPPGSVLI